VLAAFMAAAPGGAVIEGSRFWGQLVLIVSAMFLARTVAMLANRLLDRDIDRENPRTSGRAIPSGRLTVTAATGVLAACAVSFLAVCIAFGVLYGNWWPAWLGLPVLVWLSLYPLLKRFTSLCHLYLGSSLAISPLAAVVAVDPAQIARQPALWLLSAMVMCWVAGFDIIYALQDVQADRRLQQFSVPSRLGVPTAMWVSRGLHVVAAVCLAAAAWIDPRFGGLFGTAVVFVVGLLVYEHLTVERWGTTRMALAFFTLNGIISCVLGGLGLADVLIGM
jgi:4-hydroxybenzoate polyprenyltransferase